jgi:hypothetical protein
MCRPINSGDSMLSLIIIKNGRRWDFGCVQKTIADFLETLFGCWIYRLGNVCIAYLIILYQKTYGVKCIRPKMCIPCPFTFVLNNFHSDKYTVSKLHLRYKQKRMHVFIQVSIILFGFLKLLHQLSCNSIQQFASFFTCKGGWISGSKLIGEAP